MIRFGLVTEERLGAGARRQWCLEAKYEIGRIGGPRNVEGLNLSKAVGWKGGTVWERLG